jgi:hypothetical protein
MSLLLLLVAGMAALLAMDAGCYLLLRANEAGRAPPVRRLAAIAVRGPARQKVAVWQSVMRSSNRQRSTPVSDLRTWLIFESAPRANLSTTAVLPNTAHGSRQLSSGTAASAQ